MAGKWLAKDGDKSFNFCFNLITIFIFKLQLEVVEKSRKV